MIEIISFIVIFSISTFFLYKKGVISGKGKKKIVSDLNIEEEASKPEKKDEENGEKPVEKLLSEADKLIGEEKNQEAEKILIEIIQRDRKNDKAYFELGKIFIREKNYKDAINSFKRTIFYDPTNDTAFHSLGLSYYKIRNFEKAVENIQKSIDLSPNVTSRYLNLALAAKKNKDHKLAIKTLEQLISLSDSHEKKHLKFLADEYETVGQRDKAIKVWTQVLEIDSEDTGIKRKLKKY